MFFRNPGTGKYPTLMFNRANRDSSPLAINQKSTGKAKPIAIKGDSVSISCRIVLIIVSLIFCGLLWWIRSLHRVGIFYLNGKGIPDQSAACAYQITSTGGTRE